MLRKVTEEFDLAQMTPKELIDRIGAELCKDDGDQFPCPDLEAAKWNSGASSAKTPGFPSSHFGYSRKHSSNILSSIGPEGRNSSSLAIEPNSKGNGHH